MAVAAECCGWAGVGLHQALLMPVRHPRALRCFADPRGGAYAFSGGSDDGAGSGGSSFARMPRSVPIRGDSG